MNNTEIKSNTCEIIKIDQKTLNDINSLKLKYNQTKIKIFKEILDELKSFKYNKNEDNLLLSDF
tara:strand:- start:553 stop:744 length:192 start_codon:yes stop_codon:yes gene_type:complete